MTFAPVRRVVTGHDDRGTAIIRSDALYSFEPVPSGDAGFALLWTTPAVPVDNDDETDGRDRATGLALDAGTVLRIVDMLPGQSSPMHRTSSLDYGIVLSGKIELVLDDGTATTLDAGDVVVQRGTVHAWRNPSANDVCRIAFVLVGASPVTIAGRPLEPIHPG